MTGLVIRVNPERRQWWKETIQSFLPELNVVLLDEDKYDPQDIQYAVVWNPPMGMFNRFPNIKCVASVGAGVSHILKDKAYPKNVPIIRCVNEALRTRMAEYILLHVLRFHKKLPEVEAAQKNRKWIQVISPLAGELRVGIMGLGNLGAFAAEMLRRVGYQVSGWSRRKKTAKDITLYFGNDQLNRFLSEINFLVCTLPLTKLTENILSKKRLMALPEKSYFINVGRGECLVDDDLIKFLDKGHLSGATLDVFREEPLPDNHPFWAHPKILITSHTAGIIDPAIGGETIANNIKAFMRGGPVSGIVDVERGY